MDFLKKAKAGLKDIEADLTKATSSLGLGGNKDHEDTSARAGPSSSAAETPASTTMNTPGTTTANTPAPSVIEKSNIKLPLAVRKNIRDSWESKQAGYEEQISKILGTQWKISLDPAYLWSCGEEGFAKQNPGGCICAYIEPAIRELERYVEKNGEDGKRELNSLASAHAITMEQTSRSDITYTGCEISGGLLRILFAAKYLGTNVTDSLQNIMAEVNKAGKGANAAGGAQSLDFNAKMSIRNDWEPKVGALQKQYQELLKMPTLSLVPNFEGNFAALAEAQSKEKRKDSNKLRDDWQKRLGEFTFQYFEAFYQGLDNKDFGEDEMLQEGFAEAVEKGEVGLRVVDKLEKATYNECVVENGILWMQTLPHYWTTNIRDPVDKILDLL